MHIRSYIEFGCTSLTGDKWQFSGHVHYCEVFCYVADKSCMTHITFFSRLRETFLLQVTYLVVRFGTVHRTKYAYNFAAHYFVLVIVSVVDLYDWSRHAGHPLQWRHNERDGVSDHQPHDCLLNRLFRRRSKKTPKLRVTGICAGNSPVTGEFPGHRASNEIVSIWWRHHGVTSLALG